MMRKEAHSRVLFSYPTSGFKRTERCGLAGTTFICPGIILSTQHSRFRLPNLTRPASWVRLVRSPVGIAPSPQYYRPHVVRSP